MVNYDVIIVGGSAAGLSATLALARSMLKVLCVDSGKPCNRYAEESHNFLTQDGQKPSEIISIARSQIVKYDTVEFCSGAVTDVKRRNTGIFDVTINEGINHSTRKIIFATGITDLINQVNIPNLERFWGKSIIHCPYCHGFEFKDKKTVIIFQNQKFIEDFGPMIFNWSQDLTILTNGGFVPEELGNLDTFAKNGVEINHKTIESISGDDGQVKEIKFNDGTTLPVDIIYMRPPSKVNGEDILKSLDVEFDPIFNLIKADQFQKTNIPGLYAAGECTTFMRTLSCCVAQGTLAGTFVSKELFAENWNK